MAKVILTLFTLLSVHLSFASGTKRIVIIRQTSPQFETSAKTLIKELGTRYSIKEIVLKKSHAYTELRNALDTNKFSLSITLGDRSLRLIKQYKKDSKSRLINIALMGLDLKKKLSNETDMAGINFEVPALSIYLSFKNTYQIKPKKIYVFFRASKDKEKIVEQAYYMKKVGIELVAINLEESGVTVNAINKKLKLELNKLNKKKKKQFVWVILDSYILNSKSFNSIWLPAASKNKITFISGLKHLAKPELKFCAFALTPELKDMSLQAVQMIDGIIEQGLSPKEIGVEQLISTKQYINLKKSKVLGLKVKKH